MTKVGIGNGSKIGEQYLSVRRFVNLSAAERRLKHEKGLCYFCDKPYERDHKYQLIQSQVFTIEIPSVDSLETNSSLSEGLVSGEEEEAFISLSAISGSQVFHTMRVKREHAKVSIDILIDTDFVDISLIKRLRRAL